jgi:glycosyltransferase involved in cell wall biosynthesis
MKVCKVVFNSVSHDARVLKEASSVAELGNDVVIVGIQDANNRVPIEQYDDLLIRRSAWKSEALKPLSSVYYMKIFSYLFLGIVVIYAFYNVLINYKNIYEYIISNYSYLTAISIIISLFLSVYILKNIARMHKIYKKRVKTYKSLKAQEINEELKFTTGTTSITGQVKKNKNNQLLNDNKSKSVNDNIDLPRPIMAGLLKILDNKNLKTWKTIFARERTIYDILVEEMPDVVHAHDISALPICAKYKQEHGCKLVFDAHEMYDHLAQSEADMSKVNKKIMLKYSKDVDMFITINDSIAAYYKEFYPDFPKAVIVKNATFMADEVEYDGRLHQAANIELDKKILLYQGGFASKRGLLQLLMSAEYLNDEWVLVFMGWGTLQKDMKLLLSTLIHKNNKMESKVRFVPKVKQKDLPFWTCGATLGVIPYENTSLNHWFCTPNKLWEYPNAGVPIIASPFPELKKVIESNEIGWFLPDPLSPKEIAEAINNIESSDLLNARKHCRRFIVKDNWNVYAKILQKKYEELV